MLAIEKVDTGNKAQVRRFIDLPLQALQRPPPMGPPNPDGHVRRPEPG